MGFLLPELHSIATKEYIAAHFHGLVSQTQKNRKIGLMLKNPQGFPLIKAKRVKDLNKKMLRPKIIGK